MMKLLVTGGAGFLGSAICKMLLAKGYEVYSFSRKKYVDLEEMGVKTIQGDLRDQEQVNAAFKGMDAIFHVGAYADVWGKKNDFYDINYQGTLNVLAACETHQIKYLIYTSTPSVVFGEDDILGEDESLAYPQKYYTYYAHSKSLAETAVLNAKNDSFYTLALRPHLIWGPGDPHLFPRLLAKARAGKLRQVGDGENLVDIIYVDNAANAHVMAFEKLLVETTLSGNVYFIGQSEPVKLWEFINQVLNIYGLEAIEATVSFKLAYFLGTICEFIFNILGIYKPIPPMTRFVALQLAKSHYFSHAKFLKEIGEFELVSTAAGLLALKNQHSLKQQIVQNNLNSSHNPQ
jgi:nucleoside-diphosphate-sugar epimerase